MAALGGLVQKVSGAVPPARVKPAAASLCGRAGVGSGPAGLRVGGIRQRAAGFAAAAGSDPWAATGVGIPPAGMMAAVMWKVIQREEGAPASRAPSVARQTEMFTPAPGDSFCSMLQSVESSIPGGGRLVEVKMCSSDRFDSSNFSVKLDELLARVGDPCQAAQLYRFWLFIVESEAPSPVAAPAVKEKPLLHDFFKSDAARQRLQTLSLPKRRAGTKCIDQTYNLVLSKWAAAGLGFNDVDGVHTESKRMSHGGGWAIGRGAQIVNALANLLDYIALPCIQTRL